MTKNTDADRLLYADEVLVDLRQLARLIELDLPLADIAHRMAMPEKNLRKVLTTLRIKREDV